MEAIKIILVPTDFSSLADNALRYAIGIAQEANAHIVTLHIYRIPAIPAASGVPFVPDGNEALEIRSWAEKRLDNLELNVPELQNVFYQTKLIPSNWIIEVPEIILTRKADLTVMGTRGATGIKEFFFGSNTAAVIEGAIGPVLAIPEQAEYKAISNIAFALDNHPIKDLSKLSMLYTLAKMYRAEIQIFHVQEKVDSVSSHFNDLKKELSRYFRTIDHTYTCTFFEDDVENGITKFIEEKKIDLLVMMPRRHGLFHRLFKASKTQKMAFHTTIPLLAIPE